MPKSHLNIPTIFSHLPGLQHPHGQCSAARTQHSPSFLELSTLTFSPGCSSILFIFPDLVTVTVCPRLATLKSFHSLFSSTRPLLLFQSVLTIPDLIILQSFFIWPDYSALPLVSSPWSSIPSQSALSCLDLITLIICPLNWISTLP